MTDREKLIKLLSDAYSKATDAGLFDDATYAQQMEMEADYLLDNGVTVPKTGRWIIQSSGKGANAMNWAECSECHVCGSPQWKVCPVCEAKMEDT